MQKHTERKINDKIFLLKSCFHEIEKNLICIYLLIKLLNISQIEKKNL